MTSGPSRVHPTAGFGTRAIIAISLANLLLIRVWDALLFPSAQLPVQPPRSAYLAVVVNLALLAAVILCGAWVLGRIRHPLGTGMIDATSLLIFAAVLNGFRLLYAPALRVPAGTAPLAIVLLGLLAGVCVSAIIYFAWRRLGAVRRGAAFVLLILSPFAAVNASRAIWKWVQASDERHWTSIALADGAPPTPELPRRPRVVVVVFDGLDRRMLFSERSAMQSFPAFDRLQAEAIDLIAAHSAAGNTLPAIASILTGREVEAAKFVHGSQGSSPEQEVAVTYVTGEERSLLQEETLFSRARDLGTNTAVVGWYLPYCGLRGVTTCSWHAGYFDVLDLPKVHGGGSFSDVLFTQLRLVGRTAPLVERWELLERGWQEPAVVERAIALYEHLRSEAIAAVADDALGVVFVHFSIPHVPYIYDAARRSLGHRGASYTDNISLADETLGALREAMERAGQWHASAVIVTSDHSAIHPKLTHIPFLVKLPGQTAGVPFPHALQTTIVPDLVLTLLREEVTDAGQAVAWLNDRSQPGN